MHDTNPLITDLEQALFAINLTISTLKGDADPNQLHLLEPPPKVEITNRDGHMCILVKKNN